MECITCSLELKENIDCIEINSSTWIDLNIQHIIEKHLWPMNNFKAGTKWLCISCWHVLDEFHKMYTRVESALNITDVLIKSELNPLIETEANTTKCFQLGNLHEPEVTLDQTTIFISQANSFVTMDEDGYDEEDYIPLIRMPKSLETSLRDPFKDSEVHLEDPLNKKTTRTKNGKKKKWQRSSIKPNIHLMDNRQVNNGEKNLEVNADADTTKETIPAGFLFTETTESTTLRFYYQSKLNIEEYDKFITDHFQLTCHICKISVETFSELQHHFKNTHKRRGYALCCNTKFHTRSLLVDHINCHLNPEYFKCYLCSEVLTLRKDFKVHLKTHDMVHACNICDKKFVNSYFLNKHKLIHIAEEEKKFPCNFCNKVFATENMLSSHQRIIHLKVYAKLCDICGESMPHIEAFKRHMKKHFGNTEPMLSCEICGRIVACKRNLKIHMNSQHPVEKKEHVCPVCLKVSKNDRALRQHVRVNHETGYIHKCNVCEKAFKRRENLKAHMNIHTGSDLFKCPWCPKSFNADSSMHLHRKTIHPLEWEEERRRKYSGNIPPSTKLSRPKQCANDFPLQYNF